VFGKARLREDGARHTDIAIPVLGYKSHASIDRPHGFIRKCDVTDASRHDGRMLRRGLLDGSNTGTTVWADSAYRSSANETFMQRHGFRSQVHHRKPKGRPMPPHIRPATRAARASAPPSSMSSPTRRGRWRFAFRMIGIARARVKIGLATHLQHPAAGSFTSASPQQHEPRPRPGPPQVSLPHPSGSRHEGATPSPSRQPEPGW
jgi:transposase, IS5 family